MLQGDGVLGSNGPHRGCLRMRRVAIAISHANQDPYTSIIEGFQRPKSFEFDEFRFDVYYFEGRKAQRLEAWRRNKIERIRYSPLWPVLSMYDRVFLRASSKTVPEAKLDTEVTERNMLRVDTPEDQRHIAVKVYSIAKYCHTHEYDFLIRTTSNSILNLSSIVNFIRSSQDEELLYAGREVTSLERPSFISGSFLILNRTSMEFLLRGRGDHDYGVLDDVAIGKIFNLDANGVSKKVVTSVDFGDFQSVIDFPLDALSNVVHYRCKANVSPRNDLEIMRELTIRLKESRISYV